MPATRTTRLISLAALLCALLLAGCGGDEVEREPAVEAREGNVAEVAGVRYRVVLFREINVRVPPDDALWDGEPPGRGNGLYAVSLQACGAAEGTAPATGDIQLEDAFGERFAPRPATAPEFAYRPRPLAPGECIPAPDTTAIETFAGSVLVFEVPFESTAERPMVLRIGAPGGPGEARIVLDL